MVALISQLGGNMDSANSSEPVSNEDSNSLGIENPILDTGQQNADDVEETSGSGEENSNEKTLNEETINAILKERKCFVLLTDEISKNPNVEKGATVKLNTESKEDTEHEPDVDCLDAQPVKALRLKPLMELMEQTEENIETATVKKHISTASLTLSQDKVVDNNQVLQSSRNTTDCTEESIRTIEAKSPRIRSDDNEISTKNNDNSSNGEECNEEIEEPMMLVRGEGTGFENNCINDVQSCIVGEAIEEPVMYVFGEGSGTLCEMGNGSADKPEEPREEVVKSPHVTKSPDSDVTYSPTSKTVYKLGTVLDSRDGKVSSRSLTKKSRWDVGKPEIGDMSTRKDSIELDNNDIPIDLVVKNRTLEDCSDENQKNISSGTVKDLVNKFENFNESHRCDGRTVKGVQSGGSVYPDANDRDVFKIPIVTSAPSFFFGSAFGKNIASNNTSNSAFHSFGSTKSYDIPNSFKSYESIKVSRSKSEDIKINQTSSDETFKRPLSNFLISDIMKVPASKDKKSVDNIDSSKYISHQVLVKAVSISTDVEPRFSERTQQFYHHSDVTRINENIPGESEFPNSKITNSTILPKSDDCIQIDTKSNKNFASEWTYSNCFRSNITHNMSDVLGETNEGTKHDKFCEEIGDNNNEHEVESIVSKSEKQNIDITSCKLDNKNEKVETNSDLLIIDKGDVSLQNKNNASENSILNSLESTKQLSQSEESKIQDVSLVENLSDRRESTNVISLQSIPISVEVKDDQCSPTYGRDGFENETESMATPEELNVPTNDILELKDTQIENTDVPQDNFAITSTNVNAPFADSQAKENEKQNVGVMNDKNIDKRMCITDDLKSTEVHNLGTNYNLQLLTDEEKSENIKEQNIELTKNNNEEVSFVDVHREDNKDVPHEGTKIINNDLQLLQNNENVEGTKQEKENSEIYTIVSLDVTNDTNMNYKKIQNDKNDEQCSSLINDEETLGEEINTEKDPSLVEDESDITSSDTLLPSESGEIIEEKSERLNKVQCSIEVTETPQSVNLLSHSGEDVEQLEHESERQVSDNLESTSECQKNVVEEEESAELSKVTNLDSDVNDSVENVTISSNSTFDNYTKQITITQHLRQSSVDDLHDEDSPKEYENISEKGELNDNLKCKDIDLPLIEETNSSLNVSLNCGTSCGYLNDDKQVGELCSNNILEGGQKEVVDDGTEDIGRNHQGSSILKVSTDTNVEENRTECIVQTTKEIKNLQDKFVSVNEIPDSPKQKDLVADTPNNKGVPNGELEYDSTKKCQKEDVTILENVDTLNDNNKFSNKNLNQEMRLQQENIDNMKLGSEDTNAENSISNASVHDQKELQNEDVNIVDNAHFKKLNADSITSSDCNATIQKNVPEENDVHLSFTSDKDNPSDKPNEKVEDSLNTYIIEDSSDVDAMPVESQNCEQVLSEEDREEPEASANVIVKMQQSEDLIENTIPSPKVEVTRTLRSRIVKQVSRTKRSSKKANKLQASNAKETISCKQELVNMQIINVTTDNEKLQADLNDGVTVVKKNRRKNSSGVPRKHLSKELEDLKKNSMVLDDPQLRHARRIRSSYVSGKTNKLSNSKSNSEKRQIETIDLTSEFETKPDKVHKTSHNSKQYMCDEKLTDYDKSVTAEGVLMKSNVTAKIKGKLPVEEPKCVKKHVPLLTCVNIERLKDPSNKTEMNFKSTESRSSVCSPLSFQSSNGDMDSSDVVLIEDDPLGGICSENTDADIIESNPMTLTNFKISDTEIQPSMSIRSVRKRGRSHLDADIKSSNVKKRKIKGKRLVDHLLRKSVEELKKCNVSSSEEEDRIQQLSPKKKVEPLHVLETAASITSPIPKKTRKKKRKTLLGLDIPPELEETLISETNVRQSRRIAQQKIKEEAERRKIEEIAMKEEKRHKKKLKHTYNVEAKKEKQKKIKDLCDEVQIVEVPIIEEKKRRKRKRTRVDPRKIFDEANPWRSSSDSSSNGEQEEEEEDIIEYSAPESPLFKSDHEFSPESDSEGEGSAQPLKRARTAKKEDAVEDDSVDDHACQKCGKSDHPEWILLCDGCDNGWHCSCLRPALLVIPEGDWFCPPCQHKMLIKNLQEKLVEFDKKLAKREVEERRKERLAYVGISLANVLPVKETDESKQKAKKQMEEDESESSESENSGSTESTSDSDEPIYRLRQRRQAHSYRFNDYDDLINSAIQDEMEAVKGVSNFGRGKDMSTILNAREEAPIALPKEPLEEEEEVEALPPVVPVEGKDLPPVVLPPLPDQFEKPKKRLFGRKKPKKLNNLDVSSGDDADSDEDFKGSSSEEDEEEYEDEIGSDSSNDYRGKRRHEPVRRSTRTRIARYDKEFINDDSDEDDDAPRRRKTKSHWNDSDSDESNRSWNKSTKKRKYGARRGGNAMAKNRKKRMRKYFDESDSESYKKKKRKIKYGGLNEDEPEELGRRTRGKKINYLAVLASDSDDEDLRKKVPLKIDSDDDYVNDEQENNDDKDDDDDDYEENEDTALPEKTKEENCDKGDDELSRNSNKAPESAIITDENVSAPEKEGEIVDKSQQIEGVDSSSVKEIIKEPEFRDNEEEEFEMNPIEKINKNFEEMDEKEMKLMMEEEEYATRQLQLMAVHLEKEKKRKQREAKKKLENENMGDPKVPKKRGRKPKPTDDILQVIPTTNVLTDVSPINLETANVNFESPEYPPVTVSGFVENMHNNTGIDMTPKKRKARSKGKKTLEKEQTAITAVTSTGNSDISCNIDTPHDMSNSNNNPNVLGLNMTMHGGKLSVAAPPQPFSQAQPVPSVITRMLQTPPKQINFPMSLGRKYYSEEQGSVCSDVSSPVIPVSSSPLPASPISRPPIIGSPTCGPPPSQQYIHSKC